MADSFAQSLGGRRRGSFDGRDVEAAIPRNGRELTPDEPSAEDGNTGIGLECFPEGLGIGKCPQDVDTWQMVSGDRKATRRRASGDHY